MLLWEGIIFVREGRLHKKRVGHVCICDEGNAPKSIGPTTGSCHKRQKPQAPTPQEPIRNRKTRKVANAKGLNRNTNLI